MKRVVALTLLFVAGVAVCANGQSILLDHAMRAADLWCFPVPDRPHEWKYLPGAAKLAVDAQNRPEFSFIRYTKSSAGGEAASPQTVSEAEGGGVLHLLVLYDTDPQQVDRAQAELRQSTRDEELKLTGPIVFDSGRYFVISSVLPADAPEGSGATVRRMLNSGAAPVLAGNRVALSFPLAKVQANLLNQSFKMANPDVSVSFDMEFSGLADPYDATINVDWSEVTKSEKFSAGAKVWFIGADVKSAIEELQRNGAIQVVSHGDNAASEAMLNAAYTKIVELLFSPPRESAPPPTTGGNVLDTLLTAVGLGTSGGKSASWISLYGSYELKDLRSSGHTTISLNHSSTVRRHSLLTVNVGGLYGKYGNDPAYFRTVLLDVDPVFQKRTVSVSLDGALLPEFNKYIDSVTVTMKKTHQDGSVTTGEAVVTKMTAAKAATDAAMGNLGFSYGYARDDDRDAWLKYEYRTRWNFQGGATYETPWTTSDNPMISVFAPYERRIVRVLGDADRLRASGVAYAVVRVTFPFFGNDKSQQTTFRVGKDPIEGTFEVTLPANQFTTKITTIWHFSNGREVVATRDDVSGLVLLEEVPESANPGGTL